MSRHTGVFDQAGYDRRFAWGRRAVREAVHRGDVIVLVDVLSFTTTVSAALSQGVTLYPFEHRDAAAAREFAREVGAELKSAQGGAQGTRRPLSPLGFTAADEGRAFVLCSPNGATCSRLAADAPAVFAGCLRNGAVVAAAASAFANAEGRALTVIACGELWREALEGENRLRPCLEDALGAGAILAAAGGTPSPEAEACVGMWVASSPRLEPLLLGCASGRELCALGYEDDVLFSAHVDVDGGGAPRLTARAYRPQVSAEGIA